MPPRLHGYCATTVAGYHGDCAHGAMGNIALPTDAFRSKMAVQQACVRACQECSRCNVVSWSLDHHDCSWFHSCAIDALRDNVPGFVTQQVRNHSSSFRRDSLREPSPVSRLSVLRTLDEPEAIFPSQEAQDSCLVEHVFRWRTGGYYVDLAANAPKFLSNTYALDRLYNWSGLCIEPQARYMEGYARSRSCTLAQVLVGNGDEVQFIEKMDGYGNLGESHVVQPGGVEPPGSRSLRLRTVPLGQLFLAASVPPVIDYMSLECAAPSRMAFCPSHEALPATLWPPSPVYPSRCVTAWRGSSTRRCNTSRGSRTR